MFLLVSAICVVLSLWARVNRAYCVRVCVRVPSHISYKKKLGINYILFIQDDVDDLNIYVFK